MDGQYILQLDTATPVCSVAISRDGVTICIKEMEGQNIHAERLTLFIVEVLKEAGISIGQLSAVAVAKGPGSYTGLRIGVSTAKGLCYAADLPLIAIDSLESLAHGFRSGSLAELSGEHVRIFLCPMIDARRMEVYQAVFDLSLQTVKPTSAAIIDQHSFEDFEKQDQIHLFGSGADKLQGMFDSNAVVVHSGFNASAGFLSALAYRRFQAGSFEDLAYFEPYYLKEYVPTQPKSARHK